MNITFNNPDTINGKLTIVVEESDFAELVAQKLKDYRRRADVPGFRKGHAPMALIQRSYGMAVKVDTIDRIVYENIMKYTKENNIRMLGAPMPAEEQVEQDLESAAPYTFVFDIAIAPEITVKLSKRDQVPMYHIAVEDELINKQAEQYCRQFGHYDKAEQYDAEQNDVIRGTLRQMATKAKVLEGGIEVTEAMLMPSYFTDKKQQALFKDAKVGETITFNPRKAYKDNEAEIAALLKKKREEVADIKSDFAFELTEVSRFVAAEENQDLYDKIFGAGMVKSHEEFAAKIAEQMAAQFAMDAEYRFKVDMRAHLEKKAGNIELPEELLKRFMLRNNEDKGAEFVEQNFKPSIEALKWQLIKDQLIETYEVKIEHEDVLNTARAMAAQQFAQYGMQNVPQEYINQYADDMLKKEDFMRNCIDNAAENKLMEKLKTVVKVVDKDIKLDDFNKLFN